MQSEQRLQTLQFEQIEQEVQMVQSGRVLLPGLSVDLPGLFFFAAPSGTASTMRSVTRNVTAASSRGTFTLFPLADQSADLTATTLKPAGSGRKHPPRGYQASLIGRR